MTYMQVVISREAAYETIKQLGLLSGCGHPGLEFTDLNFTKTQFQRHYAPYIKRCLEIDRILRLLGSMVAKYRIAAEYVGDAAEETRGLFDGGAQGREPIESELFSLEGELVTMEKNLDIVTEQSVKLGEHMEVLRKVGPILGGRGGGGGYAGGGNRSRARSIDRGLLGRGDDAGIGTKTAQFRISKIISGFNTQLLCFALVFSRAGCLCSHCFPLKKLMSIPSSICASKLIRAEAVRAPGCGTGRNGWCWELRFHASACGRHASKGLGAEFLCTRPAIGCLL
jgi:hypothetical protein